MKILPTFIILLVVTLSSSCQEQPAAVHNSAPTAVSAPVQLPVPYGPDAITRNFVEDVNGNIWVASFDGMFRYDGKSFTNVTKPVSKGRFFDVLEDKKGDFWFTSIGEGVYHYDGTNFKNFTMKDGLLSDRVTEVYEDRSGTLWFGSEGGINRYDGSSFQNFTVEDGLPANDVGTIIEDRTGKIWFGSRSGVGTYDGQSFETFYLVPPVDSSKKGRPFGNTRCIIEDKGGNIWIGGRDGLWRYDGTKSKQFAKQFIGHVYEDRAGNIWASSEADQAPGWWLSRYDALALETDNPVPTIITKDRFMVFGILEDRAGNIWFGSNAANHFDGKKVTRFQQDLEWLPGDWRIN